MNPRARGALFWACLTLQFALAVARPSAAAPNYPALTGRVVDDAHVLAPEVQADLTQKLAQLEQGSGRQLVVATVSSLQGDDIADYGVGLLRTWKIGDKATNSGAVLIVAPAEKKVRVEVGYGLEAVLTDALSERIIQRDILPKFRAGDIQGGVVDGANALIAQLGSPDDQARAQVAAAAAQPAPAPSRGYGRSPFGALFGLALVLWFVSGLFRRNRRYGGGGGGGLGWLLPMIVLNGLGRGGRDDGGWGGGGGDGGFSGGGGSGGGGGASGSW